MKLSRYGFSQKTCEKYRKNVDFNLVMYNIELLIENRSSDTMIIWQHLKYSWVLNEIKSVRRYLEEKGIIFYLVGGCISPNYPMLPTPVTKYPTKYKCDFFLETLVVNFDGELYPSCAYFGPKNIA